MLFQNRDQNKCNSCGKSIHSEANYKTKLLQRNGDRFSNKSRDICHIKKMRIGMIC